MLKAILALSLLLILTTSFAAAATETLYATAWVSASDTITSESNGYGALDSSSLTVTDMGTSGDDATATIGNTTATGSLTNVSFIIAFDGQGGYSDDSAAIEYDDGTGTWYSVATGLRPSGLTTYGPYNASPQVTSFAEIDSMQVRIIHTKSGGPDNVNVLIDGVEVLVDYVPPNAKPAWTNNLVANTSSGTDDDVVRFNATGTDAESDNYRMTVCSSNSISDGYPGTCTGTTYCTSTATTSGSETACTYILTDSEVPSFTAYAFLCDAGSSTCNTSTQTTITVASNPPIVSVALATSPNPQNVSNTIQYSMTADDPDSNNYRMTVCSSDSLSAGYPGICNANTLCTSGATADNVEATCDYTALAADTGSLTAYGFACDVHGECATASVNTTQVESNPPYFSVALSDSPDPQNVSGLLTYTVTGTDPEAGDQYFLSVCENNGITEPTAGNPGACTTGRSICNSTLTASGVPASCTYTALATDVGSFQVYGFLCDDNGECNSTSQTVTTTVENNPPDWTNNLVVNTSVAVVGDTLRYNATATDIEADNYRLTVCDSNGINDAYPGTCTGNTLCTSTATSSGLEASCTYTTTISGTLNAYGFICDAGSSKCNSATSTSTTLDTCTYRSGDWRVNMSDECSVSASSDLGANAIIFEGDAGSFTVETGTIISAREIRIEPDDFDGDYYIRIQPGGQLTYKP